MNEDWIELYNGDWMEEMAKKTFDEAWKTTLKDFRNILRKDKIMTISDLTEGKTYECEWNGEMVYSSTGVYLRLIGDFGHEIEVHESQFIQLDKVREQKLEDLGI